MPQKKKDTMKSPSQLGKKILKEMSRKRTQVIPFQLTSSFPVPKQRKLTAAVEKKTKPKSESTAKPKQINATSEKKTPKTNKKVNKKELKKEPKKVLKKNVNKDNKVSKSPKPKAIQKGRVEKTKVATPKGKNQKSSKTGNDRLITRSSIRQHKTNPFYDNPQENLVSNQSFHRVIAGYLLKENIPNLERAFKSNRIRSEDLQRSLSYDVSKTPEQIVLLSKNTKLIKKFFDLRAKLDDKRYVGSETNLLQRKTTGTSNFYMLGRRTRGVEMTRGGREGNNAFLKYEENRDSDYRINYINFVEANTPYADIVRICKMENSNLTLREFNSCVVNAVRMGHRQLASALVESEAKDNFNDLHRFTLKGGNPPDRILPVSIMKKGYSNANITPVHTAAINEEVKVLERLHQVDPNINIPDLNNWYTIHYASVCSGTGPLEYLLKTGAMVNLFTKAHESPLYCACKAGRLENVKILLKTVRKIEGLDLKKEKSLVNQRNKKGLTPLMIAIIYERYDVVKTLLEDPFVLPNHPTSASSFKKTPLMIAAGMGLKDIVELLVENKALAEGHDAKKRTPIFYAAMNGQQHVMAYLIQLGVSVRKVDSSGNTPAHYAAAYGWTECLEDLIAIEPTLLGTLNDWKISPFSVAYLKGHYRLVSALLEDKYKDYIDINGKDSDGRTLLAYILRYTDLNSCEQLYSQLEFLIKKGAKSSVADSRGNTALHDFATLNLTVSQGGEKQNKCMPLKDYKKCFDLLLSCGPETVRTMNDEALTPMHIACKTGNIDLFVWLIEAEKEHLKDIIDNWSVHGNIFHDLLCFPLKSYKTYCALDKYVFKSTSYNILDFIQKTISVVLDEEQISEMMGETNRNGLTPILNFAREYSKFRIEGNSQNKKAFIRFLKTFLEALCRMHPASITEIRTYTTDEGDAAVSEEHVSLIHTFLVFGGIDDFGLLESLLKVAGETGNLRELLELRVRKRSVIISSIVFTYSAAVDLILTYSNKYNCIQGIHDDTLVYSDDEEKNQVNRTVLMLLIQQGLFSQVKKLVLTDKDWGAVDSEGNNVWHYVASSSDPQTIPLLRQLETYNIPKTSNNLGQTPLHKAVLACRSGSNSFLDPIEWLLGKSNVAAKDKNNRTVFHYAFGSPTELDSLEKCTTNKRDPISILTILSPCSTAEIINIPDSCGNTALHLAAVFDSTICAVSLLRKGALTEAKNEDGNSPLGLAVLYGHQSIAITLIQANANVLEDVRIVAKSIPVANPWKWSAIKKEKAPTVVNSFIIEQVVKRGSQWEAMIYVLLDALGKNVDSLTKLINCCLKERQYYLANQLLKSLEAFLDGKELKCNENLLVSFASGYLGDFKKDSMEQTVFDRLLNIGVKLIEKDSCKALELSLYKGSWDLYYYIKDKIGKDAFNKLKPCEENAGPLKAILERMHDKNYDETRGVFEDLIQIKTLSPKTCCMSLPLHGFLKNNPDLEGPFTAYGWAALHGDVHILKILHANGFDCNVTDTHGRTPLMLALASNNNLSILALFDLHYESALTNTIFKQRKKVNHSMIFVSMHDLNWQSNSGENNNEDSSAETEDESDNESEQETDHPGLELLKMSNNKININITDNKGNNIFHYMIQPYGWEHVFLLKKIMDKYPSQSRTLLLKKNDENVSPKDLAKDLNQRTMLKALTTFLKEPFTPKKITYPSVDHLKTEYDVITDSENYLRNFTKKDDQLPEVQKPYKTSDYSETGVLVVCPDTNQIMSVLMSRTDLNYGRYGFHNFYRMELIKRKDTDLWVLFTNWGRIGYGDGEYQKTPFNTLESALKEFRSVFKSKAGQEWANLETMVDLPKRYKIVKKIENIVTLAELEIADYKLPEEEKDVVKNFLAHVSDIKVLKGYLKANGGGTQLSLPFGRICKTEIEKAENILNECLQIIVHLNETFDNNTKPDKETVILEAYTKISDLSSKYYSILCPGSFEYALLPRLDEMNEIRRNFSLLKAIGECEVTTCFVTASLSCPQIDRLSYIRSVMECSIEEMNPNDTISQYLLQWIHNTTVQKPSIKGILSITSKKATEQFREFADETKQMFLFHGTKTANLIPILHQGLRADAVFAQFTGRLFGEGVYFADTFEKSRNYCTYYENRTKYMLICQVAVGKVKQSQDMNFDSKTEVYDTLHMKGLCYPGGSINYNGINIPLCPVVKDKDSYMSHSEFIVRAGKRILPRYLVMFTDTDN